MDFATANPSESGKNWDAQLKDLLQKSTFQSSFGAMVGTGKVGTAFTRFAGAPAFNSFA
jgi:hypothetical protein